MFLKILKYFKLTLEVYRNPDGRAEQLLKEILCTVLQFLIDAYRDPGNKIPHLFVLVQPEDHMAKSKVLNKNFREYNDMNLIIESYQYNIII